MGLLEVEPSCLGVTAGGSGVDASRVAAHCGDRLLSEPKAGTQPLRREPLLMPHCGHRLKTFAGLRCGEKLSFVSPPLVGRGVPSRTRTLMRARRSPLRKNGHGAGPCLRGPT